MTFGKLSTGLFRGYTVEQALLIQRKMISKLVGDQSHIDLSSISIDFEDLNVLSCNTSITSLDLSYSQISNNHLPFMAKFPNLEYLNLKGNEITNPSELFALKRLKILNLTDNPIDKCKNFKETLQENLKHCRIIIDNIDREPETSSMFR